VGNGPGHDQGHARTETTDIPKQSGPMSTITNTLVNAKAAVIAARHRAGFWCLGESEQFVSYMPNTKHQRLREPSSG
jgi:hypothetical protein